MAWPKGTFSGCSYFNGRDGDRINVVLAAAGATTSVRSCGDLRSSESLAADGARSPPHRRLPPSRRDAILFTMPFFNDIGDIRIFRTLQQARTGATR